MNLKSLSMLPDDIGPLGPPIRREQTKPAPAPTVEHRPDGTLTTNPDGTMSFEPKVAETLPQPVPVFPHAPKEAPEPGAHGFMREPLKVGDRVRLKAFWGNSPHSVFKTGAIHTVTKINDEGDFALEVSDGCPWFDDSEGEGESWERVQ